MVHMPDPHTQTQPGRPVEISEHLAAVFPEIAPSYGWGGDPCWIAWALTQTAEHNPPCHWLGRAFDAIAAPDVRAFFTDRLQDAHGPRSCAGRGEVDSRVQDVLTEICAFAWACERLGPTEVVEIDVQDTAGAISLVLHVAAAGAVIIPRRVHPQRTMDRVLQQVADIAEQARATYGASSSSGRGVLYLDLWHERHYAMSMGYRFEITEPVRVAARHYAPEHGLGYVLTRPFEWGRPLEEWA